MGQRLVITGIKNHTPIFNIYYHWSAYTESALNEADQLLKYLLRPENYNDLVLSAIKYCELNGGGIGLSEELKEAQRLYPDHDFKTDGISRNNDVDQSNEEYGYENDEKLKDSDILVPHISVEEFYFDQIDEVYKILSNNNLFQGDCCILSKIE